MTHFETLLLDKKRDQVCLQVYDQNDNQARFQVSNQIDLQVCRRVRFPIRVQVQDQVYIHTYLHIIAGHIYQ